MLLVKGNKVFIPRVFLKTRDRLTALLRTEKVGALITNVSNEAPSIKDRYMKTLDESTAKSVTTPEITAARTLAPNGGGRIMNIAQVESNLQKLIANLSEEEFIYDLLLAYGLPKNTIKPCGLIPHLGRRYKTDTRSVALVLRDTWLHPHV